MEAKRCQIKTRYWNSQRTKPKEKVQWTKGHDFMDGTPRYTFEGRDPYDL